MTQEDKELLLKDLCGRLPYGVKVRVVPVPSVEYAHLFFNAKVTNIDVDYVKVLAENEWLLAQDITEIRPYLFPLSNMTEEQMDKVEEILMSYDPKIIFDFMADGDIIFKKGNISIKAFMELTQYFDKEMLDYRGLIPMGLAIDATGLNIY